MKRFILLLSIYGMFISNFFSQDIIYTKSQTEIKAKVLEITTDAIKYKEYDFIDGPTRNIAKSNVFMIEYSNGKKEFISKNELEEPIKEEKEVQIFSRKGLHLGIHFTPGKGRISYVNDTDNEFGMNFGADLNIYFNETMGLKTGISYQKIPITTNSGATFTDASGTIISDGGLNGKSSSILFPFKFQFTMKGNVGLYFESGINFIIQFDEGVEEATISGASPTYNYSPIVFASETAVGINIKASEKVSLNLGGSYSFSFNDYFKDYDEYKGRLLGFQMGVLFKLAK